jgi:hypothetical protein
MSSIDRTFGWRNRCGIGPDRLAHQHLSGISGIDRDHAIIMRLQEFHHLVRRSLGLHRRAGHRNGARGLQDLPQSFIGLVHRVTPI